MNPLNPTQRGHISSAEAVVMWERADGHLLMAPHTNMTPSGIVDESTGYRPFAEYQRVVLDTVADIERYSRRLERQEVDKLRSLKIEDHLRHQERRNELRARVQRKLDRGECISPADEEANRRILSRLDAEDDRFRRYLTSDDSLLRGGLEIEKHESAAILAKHDKKKVVEDDL